MKDGFDGANVQAKIYFQWQKDQTGDWYTIPIGGDYEKVLEGDAGKWNFCEQDFQIKTDLNDLIVRCTADADGVLPTECSEAGDPMFVCDAEGKPKPGFDSGAECEQSVQLFLNNAGTRPAAALLQDVPNGVHNARVMADIIIEKQSELAPTNCRILVDSDGNPVEDSDGNPVEVCDIKTALLIGKRLLIVEDVHLANDAGL